MKNNQENYTPAGLERNGSGGRRLGDLPAWVRTDQTPLSPSRAGRTRRRGDQAPAALRGPEDQGTQRRQTRSGRRGDGNTALGGLGAVMPGRSVLDVAQDHRRRADPTERSWPTATAGPPGRAGGICV